MIGGATRLTGLLGWPVSHSKSPRLHGAWLELHHIDGAYLPLPVAPADLAKVLEALPRMGFVGANVTVPHKESILPLLDGTDPLAARIGAVNMLVIDPRAGVIGHNTDAVGFLLNLRECHPQFDAAAGPIVLLGAGGAARAAACALLQAGAKEIRLVNRSLDKARALAAQLSDLSGKIFPLAWAERQDALADAHLLVNSTSLGMQGQPALDLSLESLPRACLVNDLVYAPLETKLLAEARRRGNPVADGLGMLLHQARPSFAAWWGVIPEVNPSIRQMMTAP